jgi:hypothetical protein
LNQIFLEERVTTLKAFDNVGSHERITKAQTEAQRIWRRISRLDDSVLAALTWRLQELDAALVHLRETVAVLPDVRRMRDSQR